MSKADALINPVNCKGVMGGGIALEFKKRFPECVEPYKSAVASGYLVPGTLLYVHLIVLPDISSMKRPGIVLFPTKDHWKGKSRIEWIAKGLAFFRDHYREWQIKSVALPQIGCGLGGLPWTEVKQLIEQYLCTETIDVEVYVRPSPNLNPVSRDITNQASQASGNFEPFHPSGDPKPPSDGL